MLLDVVVLVGLFALLWLVCVQVGNASSAGQAGGGAGAGADGGRDIDSERGIGGQLLCIAVRKTALFAVAAAGVAVARWQCRTMGSWPVCGVKRVW